MPHPDYLLVPVPVAVYDAILRRAEDGGTLATHRQLAASAWRANVARAEGEAIRGAVGEVAFSTLFGALAPAFRALTATPAPYPPEVWPPGRARVLPADLPDGWAGVEVSFQVEAEAQGARRRLRVPARAYNPFRCAVARDVLAARWGG